jgi:hypothetical protein
MMLGSNNSPRLPESRVALFMDAKLDVAKMPA